MAKREPQPDDQTLTYAESPPVDSTMAELGRGAVLGRFVILDELGAGGMGRVYSAFDPQLDRKVAIKVLLSERVGARGLPEARRRILREAQALAKLRHAHVLTIYEVGSRADEIFLATELIEGQNLKEWLRTSRTSTEILDIFRQAGEGLATAHRANVVHRDFKPANVMVDREGRAVVVDFGLARAFDPASAALEPGADPPPAAAVIDASEADPETESPESHGSSPSVLDQTLTQTGHRLGTPAYMAPEQRIGDGVGAEADQYSFSVALWEALTDQAPASLLRKPDAPPGVPGALRRVLERGASIDPKGRYPSMPALLEAIEEITDGRRQRRLKAMGVAALLAIFAAFLFFQSLGPEPIRCDGGEEKIAEHWSAERRDQLLSALDASPTTAATTASALESYGQKWAETFTATCEATHVTGEQSTELLDLRMGCLEQRRREFGALIDILLEQDGPAPAKAAEAATGLRSVRACADTATLLSLVRAPLTPEQVEKANLERGRLARSEALRVTGQYPAGIELAQAAASEAQELGDWALLAEARLAAGQAQADAGEGQEAKDTLIAAALAAKVARHDRVAAEAFVGLVEAVEFLNDETEQANEYAAHAAALLEQLGEPAALSSELLAHTAMLRYNAGRYDEAEANYRRALELIRDELGASSPQAATYLRRLGNIARTQGDRDRALELFQEALVIAEEIFGAEHVEVARILHSISILYKVQGQYEQAIEFQERSLAIARASLGTHFRVANLLTDLGGVYLDKGEPERALEYFEQARVVYDQTLGEDHPFYSILLTNIGLAHYSRGEPLEALPYLRLAREKKRSAFGEQHPQFAETSLSLAHALSAADELDEALGLYRSARLIFEQAFDAAHYLKADAEQGVGGTLLDLERARESQPHLEAALALRLEIGEEPLRVSESRFTLAKALFSQQQELGRAHHLLAEAQRALEELGERGQKMLTEIEDWVRENGLESSEIRNSAAPAEAASGDP